MFKILVFTLMMATLLLFKSAQTTPTANSTATDSLNTTSTAATTPAGADNLNTTSTAATTAGAGTNSSGSLITSTKIISISDGDPILSASVRLLLLPLILNLC